MSRREEPKEEICGHLTEAASRVRGKTAYLLIDVQDGSSYGERVDEQFRSASLIKIPILFTYLQELQDGALDPAAPITLSAEIMVAGTGVLKNRPVGSKVALAEVARLMIVESDNVATNVLIDLLGFDAINETIGKLGLSSTQLRRKMQDFAAAAKGFENTTNASDIAKLLLRISRSRVEDSIERQVFEILLAQNLNEKLPKFLPASIKCAHKTGDIPKLEHDAGILTTGAHDMVVVALSDELVANVEGVRFCQEAGRIAAEWLLHTDGSETR